MTFLSSYDWHLRNYNNNAAPRQIKITRVLQLFQLECFLQQIGYEWENFLQFDEQDKIPTDLKTAWLTSHRQMGRQSYRQTDRLIDLLLCSPRFVLKLIHIVCSIEQGPDVI